MDNDQEVSKEENVLCLALGKRVATLALQLSKAG
jgi:hypothetical protein